MTTSETCRVKSITVRSASANDVGSTVAIRLPATTNGTAPVTVAPARVLKVRLKLLPLKLSFSPLPRLIAPMTSEPGRRVRLSAEDALKLMAVPPVPMMVPELTRVEVPNARTPV
jgi:hypothetical protein